MRCDGESSDLPSEKRAVHAYVQTEVHDKFEEYVSSIGFSSSSALLTLLILREIQIERLATVTELASRDHPRGAKISAYVQGVRAEQFRARSVFLGRSQSACAAELILREIDERWLENILVAERGAVR